MATPVSEIEERVYFATGRPFSRRSMHDDRRAYAHSFVPISKEQAVLLDYMNSRSPNIFTKMYKEHADEAYNHAYSIPDRAKRSHAIRALRASEDTVLPLYKPTDGSTTLRIFPVDSSLPTLPREIRHVLTQNQADFDLKYAQLATNAYLWQVNEVISFLEHGGNYWEYLREQLGLTRLSGEEWLRAKAALKIATYALCYGGDEATIRHGRYESGSRKGGLDAVMDTCGLRDATSAFLELPLVKAMWNARDQAIEYAINKGSARDAYGHEISVSTPKEAKSALAIVAQSYELKLLYPALQLAMESKDQFSIVLWQHDGFTVNFPRKERESLWTQRIVDVVNAEARRLGIPTRLEFD